MGSFYWFSPEQNLIQEKVNKNTVCFLSQIINGTNKFYEEIKNNEMTMIIGKYEFSGTDSFGIIHKMGEGG